MKLALGGIAILVCLILSVAALAGLASEDTPVQTGAVVDDIPSELLPIYRQAAAETCNMPWAVLAAVGKTESNHGRSMLPGVHDGANYAGAEGPMQFMPGTWAAMGVDANHDGVANVYDPVDAIWGAAKYLCHEGAGDPDRLRTAILNYSGGDPQYVDVNLGIAARYERASRVLDATVVGDYALPIARSFFDDHPDWLTKPHHCCTPATDLPVPVGTPVFAVTAGIAVRIDEPGGCGWGYQLNGNDGYGYVYCHLSNPIVDSGATVAPGAVLGYSGGIKEAPGAGNSDGAHLHFGIRRDGADLCPQQTLQAWFSNGSENPSPPSAAGCG